MFRLQNKKLSWPRLKDSSQQWAILLNLKFLKVLRMRLLNDLNVYNTGIYQENNNAKFWRQVRWHKNLTGDTLLLQYIHFGNLSITALKIHVLTLISIMKNYCKTNVILKSNDFEKLKGSLKIRKCHVVTRDFSFQT